MEVEADLVSGMIMNMDKLLEPDGDIISLNSNDNCASCLCHDANTNLGDTMPDLPKGAKAGKDK